jgi:hypothetical protein
MPKLRETLLQVQERQRRELRIRTQARCAQVLAEGTRREADPDEFEDQPNVALGLFRVAGRHNIEDNLNVAEGPLRLPGRDNNIEEPKTAKDWTTCINVTGFLLLLFLANGLILQYISLRKA